MNNPQTSKYVKELQDETSSIRDRAAYALGEIGDATAVPALIQALKDGISSVRPLAACALGKIGNATAVPALIQALKDTDGHVRLQVAGALGAIADTSAAPALIEALQDETSSVRNGVAFALGKLGDASAAPALILSLEDEDVCFQAAKALGKIGTASAVSALILALKNKRWEARKGAAEALGIMGDASAIPALTETLRDKDWDVRSASAEALGELGDASAFRALILALKDTDEDVRRNANDVLVDYFGDASAVPVLIETLKDADSFVRSYAASTLGEIGDVSAVPALNEALKDEDIRNEAAEALAKIRDDAAYLCNTQETGGYSLFGSHSEGERTKETCNMAAIHDAIRAEDEVTVEQILRSQSKAANTPDDKGNLPLVLAQRVDSKAIAKQLLAHGARLNPQWIHDELFPDELKALAFWVSIGIDINTPCIYGGETLVHKAVENQDSETIELLADLRANFNAKDAIDRTPLRIALDYEFLDIARRLVELGASVGPLVEREMTYEVGEWDGREIPNVGRFDTCEVDDD